MLALFCDFPLKTRSENAKRPALDVQLTALDSIAIAPYSIAIAPYSIAIAPYSISVAFDSTLVALNSTDVEFDTCGMLKNKKTGESGDTSERCVTPECCVRHQP